MLLEREQSALLLIDVQEKLTPLVAHSEVLVNNCTWLLRLASDLGVPYWVSEQYPQGLGTTVAALSKEIVGEIIEKVTFSTCRAHNFEAKFKILGKKQIILMGIEAHVCVLQTALDLKKAGYSVFVVVDAVSSRYAIDYKYALKRMSALGIHLVTCEMVFFEWIGQAGSEEFRKFSKKYLQGTETIQRK